MNGEPVASQLEGQLVDGDATICTDGEPSGQGCGHDMRRFANGKFSHHQGTHVAFSEVVFLERNSIGRQ